MVCPSCGKETGVEGRFCNWCATFLHDPSIGRQANILMRALANALDFPLSLLILVVLLGLAGVLRSRALVWLFFLAYTGCSLWIFGRGQTIGKRVLGIQVVDAYTGKPPGIFRMLVREWIGKWVSGFFFALGFFWAIWDRNHQAWHDKLVATVVVKR